MPPQLIKLYVHVPFCRSKCAYCDFYSTPRLDLMEGWLDRVGEEWRGLSRGAVPDTIYLGGGTPSSLPLSTLDRLISLFPVTSELREFTVEANPEDVTPEWATHVGAETPIDRVSMGIQTFDDATLSLIGRRHSSARAIEAYESLRAAGISNISCDLIYGLPGQTLDAWRRSLDRLIAMRPEHISAYLLSYEHGTRLSVMLKQGKVAEASDDLVSQMYGYLCQATRDAGYEHYEISNFALPGCRAVHNSSYWDGSSYLGLGPGAHSMVDGMRWSNPSNLKAYIESTGQDFREMDEEDESNRFNDLLITALRTSRGLDMASIPSRFATQFSLDSRRHLDRGDLIVTSSGRIAIPESRWLLSNAILLDLIRV